MLKTSWDAKLWMLRLTNPKNLRNKRWCAVLVLVAACALAVSVATRYTAPPTASGSVSTSVRKHVSPAPSWQRLIKIGAAWFPPVVGDAVLQEPNCYSRVAPETPAAPGLIAEPSLYDRPPPFLS